VENIPLKTTEHVAQSTLLWTYNHEAQNWLMVRISAVTNFFSRKLFPATFSAPDIFIDANFVDVWNSTKFKCWWNQWNAEVEAITVCLKQKDASRTKEKILWSVARARWRYCCSQVSMTGLNFKFYCHYLLGCKTRRARSRYCCSQVSSTGLNFKFYCHYPQGSSTELRCWTKRARARYCCSQGSLTVQL